jgi:hypothetical protein
LYDDGNKVHPLLKPYANINKKEQIKNEELVRETIKVIRTLGWTLDKAEIAAGNIQKPMTKLSQKKLKVKLKLFLIKKLICFKTYKKKGWNSY